MHCVVCFLTCGLIFGRCCSEQALIHGDLHTGSVMAMEGSTQVRLYSSTHVISPSYKMQYVAAELRASSTPPIADANPVSKRSS